MLDTNPETTGINPCQQSVELRAAPGCGRLQLSLQARHIDRHGRHCLGEPCDITQQPAMCKVQHGRRWVIVLDLNQRCRCASPWLLLKHRRRWHRIMPAAACSRTTPTRMPNAASSFASRKARSAGNPSLHSTFYVVDARATDELERIVFLDNMRLCIALQRNAAATAQDVAEHLSQEAWRTF